MCLSFCFSDSDVVRECLLPVSLSLLDVHQIYASKLKLHPVVVIGVLYMAEHLVGVQGLIMAVPCAVFVINNVILGNNAKNNNAAAAPV